jgi:hypothetical protein
MASECILCDCSRVFSALVGGIVTGILGITGYRGFLVFLTFQILVRCDDTCINVLCSIEIRVDDALLSAECVAAVAGM